MSDESMPGWRYFVMALLVFVLLGADMASVLVAKLIDGRAVSDPQFWSTHWYATVGAFVCSVLIWSISVASLLAWSRRRHVLGSVLNLRANGRSLVVFLVAAVVLAATAWAESGASGASFPSVVSEYRAFHQLYPDRGVVVTGFQYLYYLLESAMVVLMLAFFQRAGEKWTKSTRTPWGAIGLALSWGAAHLGTHPEGAIVVVLLALIYGIAFTSANKSAIATLALVYLGFVL